jgi:hypothetical protein
MRCYDPCFILNAKELALVNAIGQERPAGITIIGALTIVFGAIEVFTAFRHEFAGIVTSDKSVFTWAGAAIGTLYIASGLLILSKRKWAAAIAILLLGFDIMGRIALVITGLYPADTFKQAFAIAAGTAIAAIFAIYIGWKWNTFR